MKFIALTLLLGLNLVFSNSAEAAGKKPIETEQASLKFLDSYWGDWRAVGDCGDFKGFRITERKDNNQPSLQYGFLVENKWIILYFVSPILKPSSSRASVKAPSYALTDEKTFMEHRKRNCGLFSCGEDYVATRFDLLPDQIDVSYGGHPKCSFVR